MPTLREIGDMIRKALEMCPPELSSDLVDRGFFMAGGGALLRGIDSYLSRTTGLPVLLAEDPLSAVANGTAVLLRDPEKLLLYRMMTESIY